MKKKKFTTSKLILLVVFLLCLEIILFTEIFMWTTQDGSSMYSLIGVPLALMPTVVAYYSKAKSENTKGGIIYDTAMMENGEDMDADDVEPVSDDEIITDDTETEEVDENGVAG